MSASQFQANFKTNRISGVSWKKISHLKHNFIRKYQCEKISNLSDIHFKLWRQSPGGVLSEEMLLDISRGLQRYQKRDSGIGVFLRILWNSQENTSGGCSSFHITISSLQSLILFDFTDILILRYFDIFFSVIFPLWM